MTLFDYFEGILLETLLWTAMVEAYKVIKDLKLTPFEEHLLVQQYSQVVQGDY